MNSSSSSVHASAVPRRVESSDAAGLIVAVLVRFPELATLASQPLDGTVELSFVVARGVNAIERRRVAETLLEHVRSLLELHGERPDELALRWESARGITFLRLSRDVRTLSREELSLVASVLSAGFGPALQLAPVSDEGDDDAALQDELVDSALEALRDPHSVRALVGLREEKRVVVYFQATPKKAKARARS